VSGVKGLGFIDHCSGFRGIRVGVVPAVAAAELELAVVVRV